MKTQPLGKRLLTSLWVIGIAATGVGLSSPAQAQAQSNPTPPKGSAPATPAILAKCKANPNTPQCIPIIKQLCIQTPVQCPAPLPALAPAPASNSPKPADK